MLFTLVLRYGAIGLQFLILTLISHHFPHREYGLYVFVLSTVMPVYPLLGFGVSETVVRDLPALSGDAPENVRADMTGTMLGVVLLCAAAVPALAWAASALLPMSGEARTTLFFMAGFLAANGVMFNCAQLLLASGKPFLGAFFYYPAVNLALMAFSVPYMLFSPSPGFAGLAAATVMGAGLSAALALGLAIRHGGLPRLKPAIARHQIAIGIRLAIARVLYGVGLWLPTFLAGVLLGAGDAGVLGTAGRLAAAVSAVMAAIRFSVRPEIVRAFARGDMGRIGAVCGELAACSLGLALCAIAGALLLGKPLIVAAFGAHLAGVAPLLVILLVGVAAECFGGPVDEVLKMTGHQDWVLAILLMGTGVLLTLAFLFAHRGLAAMAMAQAAYSVVVFGAMIVVVRRKLGFWLRPALPASALAGLRWKLAGVPARERRS